LCFRGDGTEVAGRKGKKGATSVEKNVVKGKVPRKKEEGPTGGYEKVLKKCPNKMY